jgi:putative transposase
MSTIAKTIKLPFLHLNRVKVEEFTYLQSLNTPVANNILAMPKGERRMLTLPQRA